MDRVGGEERRRIWFNPCEIKEGEEETREDRCSVALLFSSDISVTPFTSNELFTCGFQDAGLGSVGSLLLNLLLL